METECLAQNQNIRCFHLSFRFFNLGKRSGKMASMKRRLFNIVASISLLLGIGTAAFWVRSQWSTDLVYFTVGPAFCQLARSSSHGLSGWSARRYRRSWQSGAEVMVLRQIVLSGRNKLVSRLWLFAFHGFSRTFSEKRTMEFMSAFKSSTLAERRPRI